MNRTITERFIFELAPPVDRIRFDGHAQAYWVVPYVPVRWHSTTKSSVKAWEPRKPWHRGKARRPAFWVIHVTNLRDESCDESHRHAGQFSTRREASTEAQRLAHEEKAHALLAPTPTT